MRFTVSASVNMFTRYLLIISALITAGCSSDILIEAESFSHHGGWVTDQQCIGQMGSPYLLAHGAGVPVEDAVTQVDLGEPGKYYLYVRTFNWTAPFKKGSGPGAFTVKADGACISEALGVQGSEWMWQRAGEFSTSHSQVEIALHDLTGFDGRCDAILISRKERNVESLPSDKEAMARFRARVHKGWNRISRNEKYDLVVAGGGISGICTALSAARLGLKVALVNDRPVLGGNNSQEVRVHLGGMIRQQPYPALGNILNEFGHLRRGNALDAESYMDSRKDSIIRSEKNITLFDCFHVENTDVADSQIKALYARHIHSGELIRLGAPLFADCTGDATLGVLAGAEYREGRESQAEFAESMAPTQQDSGHSGASIQWNTLEEEHESSFPEFCYGLEFCDSTVYRTKRGGWNWETGLERDMISEIEQIRDWGLIAVYSNWSYLKRYASENEEFRNTRLDWVGYIAGKRESRRLMGDLLLNQNHLERHEVFEDGTCAATWSIDLHFYNPQCESRFPEKAFRTKATHEYIEPYPIPYRCLYSKNIRNLFMAGRNISVTHVALGSVRVMRTCGMMGEVVGMAASICHEHKVEPRAVYTSYLEELKLLMQTGTGDRSRENTQEFNNEACRPKKR